MARPHVTIAARAARSAGNVILRYMNRIDGLHVVEKQQMDFVSEVAFHKTVNGALSGTLIPAAQNAELKSLLETGLKLFQSHQMHAEHLAQSLK